MKEWIRNTLIIAAMITLMLAPDYLYQMMTASYKVESVAKTMKIIIPLSIGLAYNRVKWLSISVIMLLCGLELMQFSRLACFGRSLTPYDFIVLFDEWKDIMLGAIDAFSRHWVILPAVIIPFAGMLALINYSTKRSFWGTGILTTTMALVYVVNCYIRGVPYPIEGRLTLDNTLKAATHAIHDLCTVYKPPEYKPYVIKNVGIKTNEPMTVVYIMGESSNADHMSLFGYERDTTPKLKELAKSENVCFKEGIAGAVCTKASSKFMGNVIWEPNNVKMNANSDTSLCKFAKANGFKVFYITSKENKMLTSVCNMSSRYIDVIETSDNNEELMKHRKDDSILDILEKQEFGERNLVILQQRCAHNPYVDVFPDGYDDRKHFKGSADKKIDDYDNAMLYNDDFLSRVFNKFNKQTKGKFYIIFASDHNEMFGENGIRGHSVLDPIVADIPVIVQSNDEEFMKRFRSIYKPTHYEIAMMIAGVLGFEITNPNQKENVFYINGLDFDGRNGYIELKKDIENKKVSYTIKR